MLLVQTTEEMSPGKTDFDIIHTVGMPELAVKKSEKFSALKVINKNALHPDEVKVIRGEAKILEMLVNERNIVQIKDVSASCR